MSEFEHGDAVADDQHRWALLGWVGGDAMAAFMSVMRTHKVLVDAAHAALRTHQLSLTEYAALVFLALSEDRRQPMGKIAERLMIGAGRCSYVVDHLEADGLVRRLPHPSDGRTTLVTLTGKGSDRVSRANSDLAAVKFGFAPTPDETLRGLIEDLRVVRRAVGDVTPQSSAAASSAPQDGKTRR